MRRSHRLTLPRLLDLAEARLRRTLPGTASVTPQLIAMGEHGPVAAIAFPAPSDAVDRQALAAILALELARRDATGFVVAQPLGSQRIALYAARATGRPATRRLDIAWHEGRIASVGRIRAVPARPGSRPAALAA